MNKSEIKSLALQLGFRLKRQVNGDMDLNPYVYKFAAALLASKQEVEIKRMWIDQPSTLQDYHKLNGTNVLAYHEYGNTMRVYFLSGDVISQQMPILALSNGWLDRAKWRDAI